MAAILAATLAAILGKKVSEKLHLNAKVLCAKFIPEKVFTSPIRSPTVFHDLGYLTQYTRQDCPKADSIFEGGGKGGRRIG